KIIIDGSVATVSRGLLVVCQDAIMNLIAVCAIAISYPCCPTFGDDIVMKLKVICGLVGGPYATIICFIHQTLTDGIAIARSVPRIPKDNSILTAVKHTMVED